MLKKMFSTPFERILLFLMSPVTVENSLIMMKTLKSQETKITNLSY